MSEERPLILAVGTVSLDTIESGGRTEDGVLGGSGPYFAAAARLAARVELLGVVGTDFPASYLSRLSEAGIGMEGVSVRPGETFRWHARYEPDGSRVTVGTNRETALRSAPEVPEAMRDPRALFLASTDPAIQASVLAGAGVPELVVMDTMSHWIEDRRDEVLMVAAGADVVLLNEEEAKLLGGGDSEVAVRRLLEGGCSWVVVKRGEQGAIAFGHDRAVAVSKARAVVADPTGAGDAFAGGLVGSLAGSWPDRLGMEEAMARGAAVASLAIESFSVDRLLEATDQGAGSRAREVNIRSRAHKRLG